MTDTNPDPLRIAFSPCPNDTFVFDAWAHGRVPGAPALDVTFADIDITNGMAERGELDVLKVSYAVLPWVLDEYALLPCGGALGRGCGPLVLTREGADPDLTGRTVAVPSERSTAYLLFRLWAAEVVPGGVGEIVVMPFDEIMPAVRDGKVDAGLVIHEARFTYQNYGLHNLADMGRHWEETTGLPIPLGAIIAKRSLGADTLKLLADSVRTSVRMAWDDPEASRPYVLTHAQEMDPAVADQHIGLYVNEFTADLGEDGYAAIRGLLTRAAAEGLVPPSAPTHCRSSDPRFFCRSSDVELVGDRAQQAADLLPGRLVGVAAALQHRRDVLQQGGQVLHDGRQLVRLAALRGRDGRGRVQDRHRERLVTALTCDDPELDPLAGLECVDAVGEHGGVHEDVAAVVAGEEAEALLAVEPLDLASRQSTHPISTRMQPVCRNLEQILSRSGYPVVVLPCWQQPPQGSTPRQAWSSGRCPETAPALRAGGRGVDRGAVLRRRELPWPGEYYTFWRG